MACTPGLHHYASRLQPDCSLCTGGTASCHPVCRRFGILTHPLPPIEEALRGAGLELEWSGAAHGGKSPPTPHMRGATVLLGACRPVVLCREGPVQIRLTMSVDCCPTQAR